MITRSRATLGLVALAVVLGGTMLSVADSESISDRQLSLSKTSVFEVTAPPATSLNTSDPGDRPTTPTDFPEQPPRIPHGLVEFLPITLAENPCVDCHAVDEKVEGEPTPIPASHYVDLRFAPDDRQDDVVGARYYCVACHVSPGDDSLLVGNTYSTSR